MSTTKLYTAEDLLRMPDDAGYELIEGELVDDAGLAVVVGGVLAFFAREIHRCAQATEEFLHPLLLLRGNARPEKLRADEPQRADGHIAEEFRRLTPVFT